MKRQLSDSFISDLKSGTLKDILFYVQNDNTLDLEIREGYVNIYYRGGNILRIKEISLNNYQFHFDSEYFSVAKFLSVALLEKYKTMGDWINYFPLMKQAMDFYFSKFTKEEREYQQLVVRDNNYSSVANGTDFFIVDIEYDNHKNARFDLIAVEWVSEASKRKLNKNYKPKLYVIEMKYGHGALTGSAGIKKHLDDFHKFIADTTGVEEFKNEMLNVFKQKRDLGLIPCLSSIGNSNEITKFDDSIEIAFLIANHDPASSKLKSELYVCDKNSAKFITANYMGYGIYSDFLIDFESFCNNLQ
jgi:hypothetical protein